VWERLRKNTAPVGASCWDWLEIKAGIPVITIPTQEQFVPQMANLDAMRRDKFPERLLSLVRKLSPVPSILGKIKTPHGPCPYPAIRRKCQLKPEDELFSADMGRSSVLDS